MLQCYTIASRNHPYAAFTPAQHARNKLLVARNKLLVARNMLLNLLRATCCRATCCAGVNAALRHHGTFLCSWATLTKNNFCYHKQIN